MNAWRGGAVGVAIAGLLTFVFTRLEAIMTNAFLMWLVVGMSCAVVSLVFSWGWTQFYKRMFCDFEDRPADINAVPAWALRDRRTRRGIYLFAMLSTLVPALTLGVLLRLAALGHAQLAVFAAVWVIAALSLSAASPWLWKVVFEVAVPWLLMAGRRP